jgi:hypothetical protein
MRRQHIEIGNEEELEGVAKTRMHKHSTQPKARGGKKNNNKKAQRTSKPA